MLRSYPRPTRPNNPNLNSPRPKPPTPNRKLSYVMGAAEMTEIPTNNKSHCSFFFKQTSS